MRREIQISFEYEANRAGQNPAVERLIREILKITTPTSKLTIGEKLIEPEHHTHCIHLMPYSGSCQKCDREVVGA